MATLGVPLVHALGLMVEVEHLIGSDGIATQETQSVREGGYKTIALARLTLIDRELRIDLQRAVHRGAHGHIT